MCARRFLFVVFWLTLIAVAGAFAIFQFGDRVLLESTIPKGHFAPPPPESRPDYAQTENWLARPDLPQNPSNWLPTQTSPGTSTPPAAIFYIHPTTYLERDHWNAALHPDTQTDLRTKLFVQSQASALTSAGQVWAPRYRQAAFGAFLLRSVDARQALDLAYRDVRAAFDQFLKEAPSDAPIIVAGHSQGALHLSRLLAERGQALKGRLVAAYVVGWPLSIAADLPAIGLPPCTAPEQTACVLSWQSFAEPANASLMLDAWHGTKGPSGVERRRADMLCVNPLTGTQGGLAPPAANAGTLVPRGDFASADLVAGAVGAHCDQGLLILDGAIPPLGPYVLPGNNYHVYDFALFWGSIRGDAARRLAAWQP
ncbi:DUF3089 domain-containing protein [Sphingomonas sp.]|uniref:DUF3089 domain-containing protein n=1 Tax=Sphingomonas sp. TaxID=28214 RepID=UPI00286B1469|nr:DUF3089 domain-containing protein [Sphingomonas sp.]